jgi:NAD(P)-dependent dehydrogenase (short-subunit alcohol dehydrogenase family)
MGTLDGRVAIITGGGQGIGGAVAKLFAREGATVVINDIGASLSGLQSEGNPAAELAGEIEAAGGTAVTNGADIADHEAARDLVESTVDRFGRLDVLVNVAGILRDRMIFNMSEEEWDAVIHVHLKGHFVPTRHAAAYWREQTKAGQEVKASVINTSSTSGLIGNPGQTNYGAAKAGIAAFTTIAATELSRYGVRVNALAPNARTRMTVETPGLADIVAAPEDAGTFDAWDPANIAPLVAYLGTEGCPATGKVYFILGGQIRLFQPWTLTDTIEKDDRWTVAELQGEMHKLGG